MRPPAHSPDAKVLDAAPLEESEINRLIAAARTETYRASETVPRASVEAFRPKSLLELARAGREAEKNAAIMDADEVIDAIDREDGPLPEADGDALAQKATFRADPRGLGVEDAIVALEADQDALLTEAAGPFQGEDEGGTATQERTPAQDAAPNAAALPVGGDPLADPEALERVRAEAHAAGRAEAEADARAGLTAATEILEAAAQALLHPAADVLAGLRADITEAVLRLASERAGLEIDTMPSAFVERIEMLADRIRSQATQPVLRLHPDDLAAIEGFVKSSDSLSSMRILPLPELSRGDVDLAVDGLRLSDRILGQPAPRKAARAAPKPKMDTK
jgi:flagellar assembly protein FliH